MYQSKFQNHQFHTRDITYEASLMRNPAGWTDGLEIGNVRRQPPEDFCIPLSATLISLQTHNGASDWSMVPRKTQGRKIIGFGTVWGSPGTTITLTIHLLTFPTFCSAHRSPRIPDSAFFDISDVLFCAQESQISWNCIVWDFRRLVLRTGVPEFLKVHIFRFLDFRRLALLTGVPDCKVHFFIFPTSCSAHRSPRIPGSACV